jgi:hypothetical protein
MSAFLGPIHYWLYKKIKFQDELVKELSDMAVEKGYDKDILSSMEQKYDAIESGSLEEIIDKNNIHGWLQDKIAVVEIRLAFLVTALVAENPECVEDIMKTAYAFGESQKLSGRKSVDEVYKCLDDLLLNGMPCDRVNSLISKEQNALVWQQTTDVHSDYWEEQHGNLRYYYDIREKLVSGLLKDTGITYKQLENQTFTLIVEE